MKMDAEYNEIIPAISLDRFYEHFYILSKSRQKSDQKGFEININRRIIKEAMTDMESVTFKTLKTAHDLDKIILFDIIKSTKRNFCTTILVTPPDSPQRATQFQPWRRVLRTMRLLP